MGYPARISADVDRLRKRGTVHDEGLRRRDQLQRKAAGLLNDKVPRVDKDGREVAHYVYRVAMCNRGIHVGGVWVTRSPDREHADFEGIQTCGSQWHCPICGPKIAAKQSELINAYAFTAWFNRARRLVGGPRKSMESRGALFTPMYLARSIYFLTWTNQHDAERAGRGKCKAALAAHCDALGDFKGGRLYRTVMERAASPGSIRALETTYGELNGWHHHAHDICFAGSGQLVFDRQGRVVRWLSPLYGLRRPWARELIARDMAGLKPGDIGADKFKKLRNLLSRCFDARDGSAAAEYVVKLGKEPEGQRGAWGIASEMTRSHLKLAGGTAAKTPQRCGHASPWQLLNDALDEDGDSGELFREFGLAFHGRAKLYWSPGLKALLGVPDIDEVEIARLPDARCSERVFLLGPRHWKLIISHNSRFELKRVAALEGREGVLRLLASLEGFKGQWSSDFFVYDHDPGPPPTYALYRTPDGKTHQYWGRR